MTYRQRVNRSFENPDFSVLKSCFGRKNMVSENDDGGDTAVHLYVLARRWLRPGP